MAHQRLQQGELLARQGDLLVVQAHLVAAGVQAQATVGEVAALATADAGPLPQQDPDPRHHLLDAERLAHVVVGPRVQQPHLLLLRIPRRQHQHGVLVVLADRLQDLDAIPIGQAEVQDHQVRVEVAILLQPVVDADRLADLVALGDQADAQEAADRHLIINDQDMSHLASGRTGGGGTGKGRGTPSWRQ
ncbi:hypothetical protein D3C79_766990 [compost metagenome]